MHPLLAITAHNRIRLEEVAAALIAIAGAVMLFGSMAPLGRRGSQGLSGICFVVAGVLAVVALHWGK